MTKNQPKQDQRITAVSLFSGCGGFDWGAQQAGVTIIWANDVDKYAAAAYRQLFPEVEFHEGDIRKIEKFPEADVLIGCYPCTGFSVGARRRAWNQDEERDLKANHDNFLYEEYLRALKQVKPKYLFVENVSGMKSANAGWFLQQQIEGFNGAGYVIRDQYLTSSDFGVPQKRTRLFLVGVRKDLAEEFSYSFPPPTHGGPGQPKHVSLRRAIGKMPKWPEGEYFAGQYSGHYLTRPRKKPWDDVSYTIVANANHVPLHPMGWRMKPAGKDKYLLQGSINRRLSWRECAVLQGLPKHLEPEGHLKAKYRVIGNAVPPAFGKALLTPVVDFEREKRGVKKVARPRVNKTRSLAS